MDHLDPKRFGFVIYFVLRIHQFQKYHLKRLIFNVIFQNLYYLVKNEQQTLFLKLVHTESQVNHKTQPFWVKVVHLVPIDHTLAGHVVGTIHLAPTTTLHLDTVIKI